MIYNNVLEAVGQTPLIRLNHMPEEGSAEILVKFEALNVGGSIKTRTALNMIEQAEREGLINKDTIIVEPTSGNQGIGLALVGAVKGYRTRGAQKADSPLRRGGQADSRRRRHRRMHRRMSAHGAQNARQGSARLCAAAV